MYFFLAKQALIIDIFDIFPIQGHYADMLRKFDKNLTRWRSSTSPYLWLWRHQNFDLQYLENYKYYEGRWPLIRTQIWWRFSRDTIEILDAKIFKNLNLGQGPKCLHLFLSKTLFS